MSALDEGTPGSAYYGSVPAWPASLIGPSETERDRWCELWSDPRAAVWVHTGQERAVAELVRLEQRVGRHRRAPGAAAELNRLRNQLGLTDS